MAENDERLTTPVALDDEQLSRVKVSADAALEAHAHVMQRYASTYVAHRVGELPTAPDPADVGCDTHSATLVRAVVEQALNEEVGS